MDLWSRLIGGSGTTTPTKIPVPPSAEDRLASFKREYSQALQTWNKALINKPKPAVLNTIEAGLQRLTTLLQDDALAPAPHFCITYAASTYIYKAASRVALYLNHNGVSRSTVAFLARFVDSDVDAVLRSEKFAETLIAFAERLLLGESGGGGEVFGGVDARTEEEVLELLFNVVAKLRVQPALVSAWFRPEAEGTLNTDPAVAETLFESPAESRAFPLCRLLISRAHHEGKVGDFARTGMLYLFDCATRSLQLEDWIIDSELPTLMASGLGALYSHLSRKVTIGHPDMNMPLILALSEGHRLIPSPEAESVFSTEFHNCLSTFLQHLVFWQDVLDQCTSTRIKETLEEHFHFLFLQQILYPSLLQSSDIDGGSSVAVLTYCWRVLETLHHPDLIRLFLGYLLAVQKTAGRKVFKPAPSVEDQSVTSVSSSTPLPEQLDPSFFSLVDLLINSTRSPSSETVTAAMRVITAILSQHHLYAISNLVQVTPSKSKKSKRTYGALGLELEVLISMARNIGGEEGMDDAYEHSLKDALAIIESHACSQGILGLQEAPQVLDVVEGDIPSQDSANEKQHYNILLSDPLLLSLTNLLDTFFTNDIEVNLGLTGVFAHLASCALLRLDGWLVVDPSQYIRIGKRAKEAQGVQEASPKIGLLDELDRLEQKRIDNFNASRVAPSWLTQSEPLLLKSLRKLAKQLVDVKSAIPEFDNLVASRKRAFEGAAQVEEDLAESAHQQALMGSDPSATNPNTPLRKPTEKISNTPQRGRTTTATAGKYKTPTSSPKPSETYPRSWLTSSPLYLLSPVPPEPPELPKRRHEVARTGSPAPLNRVEQEEQSATPSINTPDQRGLDLLERQIKFNTLQDVEVEPSPSENDAARDSTSSSDSKDAHVREASLSHVVTNVVILQEFVMEMAALIQVRSGLFDGELKVV